VAAGVDAKARGSPALVRVAKVTCHLPSWKVTCGVSADQPVVLDSARRHGIDDEDRLHAFRNPVRTFLFWTDLTMVIGADSSGRLLEVGVVESRDEPGLVIVHAMTARSKLLR
jgi:hypothetical protein